MDQAVIWEWLEFSVRWLHEITAIAWIGSSFYFIALDLGLHRDRNLASGADGEEWQVHGGGFYHIQKYLVAPAQMPEHLNQPLRPKCPQQSFPLRKPRPSQLPQTLSNHRSQQ